MKKISDWLKHFFIPNEGNDHQPHSLRTRTINSFLALVIFVEIIALSGFFPLIEKQLDYFAAVLPSVLVDEANLSRFEIALTQLSISEELTEAAQLKANDMANRGYFSHNTPEGLEPWIFLTSVGYKYTAAGENLAVNFSDSHDAHNAWMNSPGHRANILQNQFTEVGIATARGEYKGRSTVFVVQFFGRPQEKQFALTPETNEAVGNGNITGELQNQDVLGESVFKEPTFANKLLSSPRLFSNYVFGVLGGIILLALILKVVFHIKKQYLKLIINSILFLIVLILLYIFNKELTEMVGMIN